MSNGEYPENWRVFLAIALDEATAGCLADTVRDLRALDPAQRWAREESLHITLKFLGATDPEKLQKEMIPALGGLCRGRVPLSLEVRGVGQFPERGRPRIYWAGVEGDVAGLCELAMRLEAGLEPLGYPRDDRPFRPHVTLARLRRNPSQSLVKAWDALKTESFGRFKAHALCVYRSVATPGGAVYRVIDKIPIA